MLVVSDALSTAMMGHHASTFIQEQSYAKLVATSELTGFLANATELPVPTPGSKSSAQRPSWARGPGPFQLDSRVESLRSETSAAAAASRRRDLPHAGAAGVPAGSAVLLVAVCSLVSALLGAALARKLTRPPVASDAAGHRLATLC